MKSNNPLVTVYIVNHNYGKYLKQAIESVLKQTLQNFEMIIIDNDSKDNSFNIIKEYKNYKKISIVFQKNIGLNATNNVAIKMAKGKYIMRLDADDYLDPNALQLMSSKLENNSELGLVFPDYYIVDQNSNILELVRRHNFSEVKLLDQPAHGACTMARRDFLIAVQGYDESYHCQDGWDIWLKFINNFGVENINLPLFFYRKHKNSLSANEKKILSTRAKILKKKAKTLSNISNLAVIPVRGPELDKASFALKKIGDKHLIDWTIDEAIKSKSIDKIVITTPSDLIEKHVKKKYKDLIRVFKRDWTLAAINVSLDKTLTDLFNRLPSELNNFNVITILYIEYPFRNSQFIDMAINALKVFDTDRVISMRIQEDIFYSHKGAGIEPLKKNRFLKQEKEEIYKEAGGIFTIKRGKMFRESKTDRKIGHICLDEKASLGVYSKFDWNLAKLYAKDILKNYKNEKN